MGERSHLKRFCAVLMMLALIGGAAGGQGTAQPQTPGAGKSTEQPANKLGPIWSSSHPSFAAIDKHALKTPAEAETAVATLAAHLVRPAKNDAEKARAFFRWVTDRIAYNAEDFAARRFGDTTPEKTLKTRRVTCEGYTRLFKALCDEVQVECVMVPGYVKDGLLRPGVPIQTNHGWNAVKLDGRWYLLDPTWGAGELNPKTQQWEKQFREYFFLTPPERLIFTHFPEKTDQQLLKPAVTAVQFAQRLQVPSEFLLNGMATKAILGPLETQGFRGFASIAWDAKFPLRIIEAPAQRHLQQGQTYRFRFEAPQCPKMFASLNGNGKELTRQGNVFEVTVTPRPGKLQIGAQFPGKGMGYWAFMAYDVE